MVWYYETIWRDIKRSKMKLYVKHLKNDINVMNKKIQSDQMKECCKIITHQCWRVLIYYDWWIRKMIKIFNLHIAYIVHFMLIIYILAAVQQ